MSHEAFRRALARFDGNQSEFARAIGTSQQRVSYILQRGNACPAELVLAVERATSIPRFELRSDIYPPSEPQAAAAA
ncbi:transcriptional regulator [Sphingomonas sp. MMS24-J13]|uniref:transcriptional regulator n=1 Tax=Sphingomonas sp. MMS24-J13 TaxID=3238686 RepID=UPI00384DB33E